MAETAVYLSLGSNLGDREKNLRTAITALGEAKVRVTRVSSFYETEPGVYRWSEITEGRLAEIELEALQPKPMKLHRLVLHRTT